MGVLTVHVHRTPDEDWVFAEQLGDLIHNKRVELGLTPKEAVLRCGWKNINKGLGALGCIENGGSTHLTRLEMVVKGLEVPPDTITDICLKELKRWEENWISWAKQKLVQLQKDPAFSLCGVTLCIAWYKETIPDEIRKMNPEQALNALARHVCTLWPSRYILSSETTSLAWGCDTRYLADSENQAEDMKKKPPKFGRLRGGAHETPHPMMLRWLEKYGGFEGGKVPLSDEYRELSAALNDGRQLPNP